MTHDKLALVEYVLELREICASLTTAKLSDICGVHRRVIDEWMARIRAARTVSTNKSD